jgi:phosphoenolpyruvate-protein phosphotransferase
VDRATERERLRQALDAAAADLATLEADTTTRAGPEIGAIFGAQALFVVDPAIVEPALAAIDAGATAEEAIDRIAAEQADILAGVDDEYFRERAADLRDVGRRIVDTLVGRSRPELHHRDGSPAILAADDLDPSVVAALRAELVAGIALAGGAPSGHAAIVARALGIPLVLGLGGVVREALADREVVVDGAAGTLIVEPTPEELERAASVSVNAQESRVALRLDRLPVRLEANVGSVREAQAAAAAGAEGIGLVRTELLFLGRSAPPGLEEQRSIYRAIAGAMAGRPVVFRTLDIGGDKPASYLGGEREMNPALGVRGLRLGLARPDLLGTQLRALLEAAPEAPLRIMLPMVSTVEEVVAARAAIEQAAEASRSAGSPISGDVLLGIMVEVPAVAVAADAFAPHVDFFSIGTNDLIQYALAADRTNPDLAGLASPFQPAIVRLVRMVVDAARPRGVPVAVCGEAAADPAAARLFVGLGVDELSVAPASIATVAAALASTTIEACQAAARRALVAATAAEIRTIASDLDQPSGLSGSPVAGSPAA